MIVEGYSADVYCECEDHKYCDPGSFSNPAVFTGRSNPDTNRKRRAAGWIKVGGRDVCPQCKTREPMRLSDYSSDMEIIR